MADQVLERFHRALIEEIQTQRPEYLTQPFTVAEIYQNLVPYGSHRDRIGVEMNGDYEDALVRLLAGEGGYLILDSEPALRNLRAALESPNPNTGVYREFAAVDVRLNQAYLDLSAEALDQLPDLAVELEAEDPVVMTDLAPAEGNATAEELGVVPPGVDIFGDAEDDPERAVGELDGAGPGGAAADSDAAADLAAADTEDAADADHASGAEDRAEAEPDSESEGRPEGAPDSEYGPADVLAAGSQNGDERGAAAPEDPLRQRDTATAVGGSDKEDAAAPGQRRPPLAPEYVEVPEEAGAAALADEAPRSGRADDGSCVWCRADLPAKDNVNFCPFCGTDLGLFPCPSCGAEVEPGWHFCAACGAEVDG